MLPLAVTGQRRRARESGACGTGMGGDTSPPEWCCIGLEMQCNSFSPAQKGCDDARIAATVNYGQDKEWFFIGCVRDQKIP